MAEARVERRWPPGPWLALVAWLRALSADDRDALLYGMSMVFAGVTALAATIPLYREWGRLAVGPYAAGALGMLVVAHLRRRASRRPPDGWPPAAWSTGRGGGPPGWWPSWSSSLGATVVPLALEVTWASHGDASLHVQPEVLVVERAGIRAAHGEDPYQVVDRNGHILIRQTAVPVYELYYPYLPGMVIFGFSSGSKVEARLTDARIQFLLFTVVVALIALSRIRPRTDARNRAFQTLTALPTAALPLATGGDDMPVVALMLLGLVALQRRRPVLAGLALGCGQHPQVHRLAGGVPGPVRGHRPPAEAGGGSLPDRRGRAGGAGGVPRGPAQPVGLRGQRHPVPAGPGRRGLPGGQRPARARAGRPPSRRSTAPM